MSDLTTQKPSLAQAWQVLRLCILAVGAAFIFAGIPGWLSPRLSTAVIPVMVLVIGIDTLQARATGDTARPYLPRWAGIALILLAIVLAIVVTLQFVSE